MDLVEDYDPIEDILLNESPADDYSPAEEEQCCDPWGDFKMMVYTDRIRQILLDYFTVIPHTHDVNPHIWFQFMELDHRDHYTALQIFYEVIDELTESAADDAAELDPSEWTW